MNHDIRHLLDSYLGFMQEAKRLEERLAELHSQRQDLLALSSPEAEGLAPLDESIRHLGLELLRLRVDCARAEQLIASLSSPRERAVLSARYLEGQSWSEIIYRSKVSESLIYRVHRKAISALSDRYEKDENF